ncbi:hypothetical protein NDN08_006748 [Rhodosorus marinus]|uniref:Serine aminopeptidase S33 domain-containing protein n=1 Tax=Rhodosorus marinus TaxID=101924 RepID=A0AAV8ULM9_9RHOD|nr:hypothetical protein NDN08_006748 [Rhodosorus marinus]
MGFLLPFSLPESRGPSKTLKKRRRRCSITSSQWSPGSENPESTSRRALLAGLASLPFVTPAGAEAFCGDAEPFWAHYIDWQEGLAPIGGRDVYLRVLGNQKQEKRVGVSPLIVLADAGLPWNYLETVSALAEDNRRVVFFDALGCGKSAPLRLDSIDEIFSAASEEVLAVAQFLELKTMHIFGHGFGAAVALDVASKQQSIPVRSVVLESPTLQGGTEKEISPSQLIGETNSNVCIGPSIQGARTDTMRKVYTSQWNKLSEVNETAQPVLVVSKNSGTSPYQLKESIQDVRIGTSRSPHLERTTEFNETVRGFLTKGDPGTKKKK